METSKSPKKQSKIVNGFEIGQVLGKGKFGEVFLGRHREAGFVVALKKVVKSKVAEFKMVEQFCNEIRLHSCLDHSNIVRFYGCFEEG
jgi:serine/threonine protein kinase